MLVLFLKERYIFFFFFLWYDNFDRWLYFGYPFNNAERKEVDIINDFFLSVVDLTNNASASNSCRTFRICHSCRANFAIYEKWQMLCRGADWTLIDRDNRMITTWIWYCVRSQWFCWHHVLRASRFWYACTNSVHVWSYLRCVTPNRHN